MPRYIPIEVCEVVKETADAFLFDVDDKEYWIPKSQIEDPDKISEGDEEVSVWITKWIAGQKGLL